MAFLSADGTVDGIVAALAAQLLMAIGFLIWDKIWSQNKGSAFALNLYKCNLASVGFVAAALTLGLTTDVAEEQREPIDYGGIVGWLMLSGFIGIVVGDWLWLEALGRMGAVRVVVVDCLKPFCATVLGRWILGERVDNKIAFFSGVCLTVVGVAIVGWDGAGRDNDGEERASNDDREVGGELDGGVDEKGEPGQMVQSQENDQGDNNDGEDREMPRGDKTPAQNDEKTVDLVGIACALSNVVLDTYGSVLTKQHGDVLTTWTINLVRFGSAGILLLIVSLGMRSSRRCRDNRSSAKEALEEEKDEEGSLPSNEDDTRRRWYELPRLSTPHWIQISLGVLFVTFLCPALSNYALFRISLGLASVLGSTTPLYALLLEWPMRGTRPTLISCGGAVAAVGGVVVLSIFREDG